MQTHPAQWLGLKAEGRGKRVGSWGERERESKRTKARSCNREQILGVVLVEYKQVAQQRH